MLCDLQTPRLYCAANVEDLTEVIVHIKQKHPTSKLGAAGISMGGLILGNYLARNGVEASEYLTACQIISVPWDVHKGKFFEIKSIKHHNDNVVLMPEYSQDINEFVFSNFANIYFKVVKASKNLI